MTDLIKQYQYELAEKIENKTINTFDECVLLLSEIESYDPYPLDVAVRLLNVFRCQKKDASNLHTALIYSAILNASSISEKALFTLEEWANMLIFDDPDHPELTAFLTDSLALTSSILYGLDADVTQNILSKLRPLLPYLDEIVAVNRNAYDGKNKFISRYLAMHDSLLLPSEGMTL